MEDWRRKELTEKYTFGCLSPAEAQEMVIELNPIAGWYPVILLSTEDVLTGVAIDVDEERDRNDTPEEIAAAKQACEYVAALDHSDLFAGSLEMAMEKFYELTQPVVQVISPKETNDGCPD